MNAALGRIALTVAAAGCIAANSVAADPTTTSSQFRVSTIESLKVQNAAGEELGTIKDLVIDFNSGKVLYAALDFGSFLGIGGKLFAVPWNSFKYVEGSGERHLQLNVNKEQLKNAPGFDKNHWPDMETPNWSKEIDKYYEQLKVTVHTLESSEGAGRWAKWAATAWVTKSKTLVFCWRQVSIAVSIVSTKRLPAALCVPKESFRQITA